MLSPAENALGKALKSVVISLVKNGDGKRIHAGVLDTAKKFEAFQWEALPAAEKAERLAVLRRECGPGSAIEKFFKDYPHPFTRAHYEALSAALSAI